MRRHVFTLLAAALLALIPLSAPAQKNTWRQATDGELAALLPARAPVEKEHIETEMRTASGITSSEGRCILERSPHHRQLPRLNGKYSHYLVVQVPVKIGTINLTPGEYVFGWQRDSDALNVHLHEALTGKLIGTTVAHRIPGNSRVESLRIWPPGDKAIIQIGRFSLPYELADE